MTAPFIDPHYTHGKPNSEGEDKPDITIGVSNECVVVLFANPIAGFSMSAADAVKLAQSLIVHAREISQGDAPAQGDTS
jgi:hypothetical protein